MGFLDYTSYETLKYRAISPFECELGGHLPEIEIAYRKWGSLNKTNDNVILICHGLTGSADADRWWREMFGAGKPFDPEKHFIISINALGSCYGSTSPVSLNPITNTPYRSSFPLITIRDMVRSQRLLLDALGIQKIRMVIGGSLGGMQALEWAIMYPNFVDSLVAISTSGKHSAWCIGVSEAQRQAIYADQDFNNGDYDFQRQPQRGLSSARMMAMLTYRSMHVFEERFKRNKQSYELFEVESYLRYQGQKLVDRFDANTYITLTKAMDTHDLSKGRGDFNSTLKQIIQPALIISASSDILYLPLEQEILARYIPKAELKVIETENGHDTFLIEVPRVADLVFGFQQSLSKHIYSLWL